MTSLLSSVAHQERLVDDDIVATALQNPQQRHKRNRVLRRIAVLFVAWLAVTVWALWTLITGRDDPWSPLGPYPEQQAQPVVTVWAGQPAVVEVTATKCAEQRVLVTGTQAWVSTDPTGSIIVVPTGGAVSERAEGCKDWTYRDAVPPEVVAATLGFGGTARWRLTGVETPISADETGVPVPWTTTEIEVIVHALPL